MATEEIKLLDELIEKYNLTDEENKKIGDAINENMLYGKRKPKVPFAIIDMGPPGSGKTGLNGYAVKQFVEDGIVVVNNDELKPYHPKADEIASLYPEYYNKIINEDSKLWTDGLVDAAVKAKVNVLYEGTGRKIGILKRLIENMHGYKIIIRAMAVSDLNCLMSIVERYDGQVKQKGWGRIVSADTFYKAYDEEMLETVDTFERTGLADMVEVYMRGDKPESPVRIYSTLYREYYDAKTAIKCGREKDRKAADKYFTTTFSKETFESQDFSTVHDILDKINTLHNKENKEMEI